MKKSICIILLLTSLWVRFASAQSLLKKIFTRAPYDTSYVDSYYDNYLHVTALSVKQAHQLSVINNQTSKAYLYRPNSAFRFGVGLDYRYFSIEYAAQVDLLHSPDKRKGHTDIQSLRLGITGRRILASLLIQEIRGMYVNNPQDWNPTWDPLTDNYPFRRDLRTTAYLGSMYYFFNHRKYSTMASLWQIDRQKKSAGSFTVGITTSAHFINSDTALSPRNFSNNPNEPQLKEDKNYQFGLNVGYAYNFILKKKFFANAMLVPGVNLQYGEEKLTNGTYNTFSSRLGFHGDIRAVGGYNGELFYGGLMYSNYFMFSKFQTNTDIDFYHEYIRIFFGRRFDVRRKSNR